eukprot:scaffold30763_cov30-Tisochrysis_lutea.AAC.2
MAGTCPHLDPCPLSESVPGGRHPGGSSGRTIEAQVRDVSSRCGGKAWRYRRCRAVMHVEQPVDDTPCVPRMHAC